MALYHYQAALGLVPQEVWFVGYILAHRWTASLPYPSLRRMGRQTGVSTQMLHRYKQSLVEKGYLVIIARHRPSGGRSSNFYDFTNLFHTLESLLVRDRRDTTWGPTIDDGDDRDGSDLDPTGDPTGPGNATPTTPDALRGGASTPATLVRPMVLAAPVTSSAAAFIPVGTPPAPHQAGNGSARPSDPGRGLRQRNLAIVEATAASPVVRPIPNAPDHHGLETVPRSHHIPGTSRPGMVHGGRQRTLSAPGLADLPGLQKPELIGAGSAESPAADKLGEPQRNRKTRQQPFSSATQEEAGVGADAAKRALQNVTGKGTLPAPATTSHPIFGDGARLTRARWQAARECLASEMSAAAFNAWLGNLVVAESGADMELAPASHSAAKAGANSGSPCGQGSLDSVGARAASGVTIGGAGAPGPAGHDAGPPSTSGLPENDAESAPLLLLCASAFQRDQLDRRYRRQIERALGAPVTFAVRRP